MPATLFTSEIESFELWQKALLAADPDLELRAWPDCGDRSEIDSVLAWTVNDDILALPNLRLIQVLAAGVDHLLDAPIPDHIAVARLVEPRQIAGFVEYVTAGVLGFHRELHIYRRQQQRGIWQKRQRRLASECVVGIMGLGEMGLSSLKRLAEFGFDLRGWSRTRKDVPGIRTFAGERELDSFLDQVNILVCALPLTPQTRGILCRGTFERLAENACVMNVGRGGHCVDTDLIEAIRTGRLGGALIDVMHEEPLPPGHPFWTTPGIEITPHIATTQNPESAAAVAVDNIHRMRRGDSPVGLVNMRRNY